ncbi:MAG: T9SS type A sorting domain-containing protein [Bacteroidota bacterium]
MHSFCNICLYVLLMVSIWIPSAAQIPPNNPFIIDSPFPFVHQNNYRQGYSDFPALRNFTDIDIRITSTPQERVSPWLLLSAAYPNGSRTLWGSSSTHIWKARADQNGLALIDDYQIDFNPGDRSWSFLMLPDRSVLTSDDDKLLVFAERDLNDPNSSIYLKQEVSLPPNIGQAVKLNRLYNGNIMFAADDGYFGLLNDNLQLLDTFRLDLAQAESVFDEDETAFHNDYASDENGGAYIVTTERMIRLDVSTDSIWIDWEVSMDFGGNGLQGVGTTPTLLGTTDDRLVCVVNSKSPAEMVVFWRDQIPSDWSGLAGMNIRVAAVVPLPGSSPINSRFAAVENSPVAYGYGIACGQYNGFLGQSCPSANGVYKLEWDPASNSMSLQWFRSDINLNNVLMYSRPDNLIYGSGRENDCNYYYYGIDWNTGNTVKRFLLGSDSFYDDPGDANIILENQSIVFNTRERLIQLFPQNPVSIDPDLEEAQFQSYPNPVIDQISIKAIMPQLKPMKVSIFTLRGEEIFSQVFDSQQTSNISLSGLTPGFYFLQIEQGQRKEMLKILKQ